VVFQGWRRAGGGILRAAAIALNLGIGAGEMAMARWLITSLISANGPSVGTATISRRACPRALAEPHRRAIVRMVRDEPKSINQIAEHFDITQPAVSLHLKVLHVSGLVRVERLGQRRLYRVYPDGFDSLRDFPHRRCGVS
jgi:DNA-binding transcriptional ArsR family regulator